MFASNLTGAALECSLDLGPFTTCTSPHTYTQLAEGEHFFQVRARGPHGIPDQSPAEYEWTVDLLPDTTIASGPPSQTLSTVANFDFLSNEPLAEFECALDGESFGSCPEPPSFIDLLQGTHELLVRAVDPGGQVDPTPAVYRWTVGPPPDTFVNSGPEEATESTTATFVFGSNRTDVTFECALDEAVENLFFQPCSADDDLQRPGLR